jgi:4'-phosphopantetheinyl transferase
MSEAGELWAPPPLQLRLAEDEIHIWRAWLDRPVEAMERTLSVDERARADRFQFDRDRRRFVAGRAILRAILARYLDLAPGAIVFRYLSHGKPALAVPSLRPAIEFNLAHADRLALYVFSASGDVGIDVERLRPIPDAVQIAERFFAAGERASLRSLPPESVDEAFLGCWTRKEACLKAVGHGLSAPLDACEVTLAPGEPARLLRVVDDSGQGSPWLLRSLVPAPGYLGACAARGGHRHVRTFGWCDLPA